jgi:hypothetical protein
MTVHQPHELWRSAEVEAKKLDIAEFVSRTAHKRLREKWCAARFGMGYAANIGPCEVEIEDHDDQERYDFKLRAKERLWLFQIAEVLRNGRRRHDEYRSLTTDEIEERNHDQIDDAAKHIKETIKKKTSKYKPHERTDMHLLLYVNLNARGVSWVGLALAVENEVGAFASVWAMTHDLFCCLHGGNHWPGHMGWKPIDSQVEAT